MEGHADAGDEQPTVHRVPRSRVDARASQRRAVARARKHGERPSQREPADDDQSKAGGFEEEAGYSQPRRNTEGPARADDGAHRHRDEDDRLEGDPALTASPERGRFAPSLLRV